MLLSLVVKNYSLNDVNNQPLIVRCWLGIQHKVACVIDIMFLWLCIMVCLQEYPHSSGLSLVLDNMPLTKCNIFLVLTIIKFEVNYIFRCHAITEDNYFIMPGLDLSGTPGLRPIGLSPGSWQTSLGLGSMSRYSAQIIICISKT